MTFSAGVPCSGRTVSPTARSTSAPTIASSMRLNTLPSTIGKCVAIRRKARRRPDQRITAVGIGDRHGRERGNTRVRLQAGAASPPARGRAPPVADRRSSARAASGFRRHRRRGRTDRRLARSRAAAPAPAHSTPTPSATAMAMSAMTAAHPNGLRRSSAATSGSGFTRPSGAVGGHGGSRSRTQIAVDDVVRGVEPAASEGSCVVTTSVAPTRAAHRAEQIRDDVRGVAIEARRGLVGEHDRGLPQAAPSPPPPAAAHRATGSQTSPSGRTPTRSRSFRARDSQGRLDRPAIEAQGQHDVLERRQPRKEVELLKDEADRLAAPPIGDALGQCRDFDLAPANDALAAGARVRQRDGAASSCRIPKVRRSPPAQPPSTRKWRTSRISRGARPRSAKAARRRSRLQT